MPYSPITTWAPGDTIDADLLDADLEGIKEYLSKIPKADLATGTPWVDTNHLVKGYINPTINQAVFISGNYAGQNYHHQNGDLTYATSYVTDRLGTTVPYVHLPKSSLDFEIESDCSILFTYWLCPITRDDKNALYGYNDIFIWSGNLSLVDTITRARSLEEDTVTANYAEAEDRYFLSGAKLVTGLSSGTYHLGLGFRGTAAKTQVIAWGISAQLFAV